MKFATLIATAGLLVFSTVADDKELQVIKSTAKELDTLVSQTNVAYKEVIRPGFATTKHKIPPVPLSQVAPAVSERLKIDEKQIVELLTEDKTKLSELVIARLIQESGGQPYQELLARKDSEALYRLVQERQLTTRVKTMLDEIFTEVSFISLDGLSPGNAIGAPPAGNKGQEREKKKE
jgi:hypothetical protein